MGSWVCGWVDFGMAFAEEGVSCWRVVDGFFLGLWVTVVVGWLVAMGFVVGCAIDRCGLF